MFELRLICPETKVEELCDALDAAGALSVSIEDANAGTAGEQAIFGEPGGEQGHGGWQHSCMLALFSTRSEGEAAQRQLARLTSTAECKCLGVSEIPDQDWVRVTQAQFAPIEVATGFWIVPSWHEPPEAARRLIRLDPGLAFGTGAHPTTRMCLRWLASRGCIFGRVLDYGCGSGILAIGAALLGALEIDAVDIDQAAVDSARANALANGVHLRTGLPDLASGKYDLVLCNILASPLKVLAPLLTSRVAPGGWLVLAGILERQAEDLMHAYAPYAKLEVTDSDEGWVLMTGAL
ncbi:MAG: 50S ribosomal protein L11 methyltransferase [Candidatus Methylophosphatis roskildensis]